MAGYHRGRPWTRNHYGRERYAPYRIYAQRMAWRRWVETYGVDIQW